MSHINIHAFSSKARAIAAALAMTLALVTACSTADGGSTSLSPREREVADRGADVMPFDLDATTHMFEERSDGVTQRVVADDPEDAVQVVLIRRHLREEASRFSVGDFSDPVSIHGASMPGVKQLSASAGEIDVGYVEIDGGALLTFDTTVPSLVLALHDWATAQVNDHGPHAGHG